jgi:hypothetical protein
MKQFIAEHWPLAVMFASDLAIAGLLIGSAAMVLPVEGCAGAQPTPTQEAAPIEYAAELEACIDKATTLAESQACRAAVRAKWGRK